MHFTPQPIFILAALFSVTGMGAHADCTNHAITNGESNVLARLDAMASCIAAQQREIDQLRPLASAIIVSEAPCATLGEGWTRYSAADGRFLLGAGDRFQAGSKGGEEAVTLSIGQMPSHSHVLPTDGGGKKNLQTLYNTPQEDEGHNINPRSTRSAGGGEPHNNMPPYLTVRFCKRG